MFGGYADSEWKAVEARSPMDIEAAKATGEKALIRPFRHRQRRPVDAKGDEANLTAVSMTRENEIDVVLRKGMKPDRIVE